MVAGAIKAYDEGTFTSWLRREIVLWAIVIAVTSWLKFVTERLF